jgi:hypothetical protein
MLCCAQNAQRIVVGIAQYLIVRREHGRPMLRKLRVCLMSAGFALALCFFKLTAYTWADDAPPINRSFDDNSAVADDRVNPLRGKSLPASSPWISDSLARPSQRDTAIIQLQAVQPLPSSPALIGGGPTPASQFPQQFNPSGNAADCAPSLLGRQNEEASGSHTPAIYQPEHYPRALGFGQPLVGTSWQNRPFHADFFTGTMIGDDAIDGVIGQEAGFFVGGRLGWDYDYYWGVESRLGTAWMSLFDRQHPENNIGTGNILVWDMSLLYYPWGDSRWRPFVLVGTGIEQLDSYGSALPIYSGTLFELPFGAGLKYRFNEWLTWRVDVVDNFAIGTGSLDTMHNVSFSAGLEYRFGGHRRTYWPWNPNPKH